MRKKLVHKLDAVKTPIEIRMVAPHEKTFLLKRCGEYSGLGCLTYKSGQITCPRCLLLKGRKRAS